jgi:hypothetical protein
MDTAHISHVSSQNVGRRESFRLTHYTQTLK